MYVKLQRLLSLKICLNVCPLAKAFKPRSVPKNNGSLPNSFNNGRQGNIPFYKIPENSCVQKNLVFTTCEVINR